MEAYDADELVSYRSLSSLAVLALFLGLLSSLALIVPLFIVIPLMGVAVALLACRSIQTHTETLTGITLAKIALFLSVFCLVAVPVKSLVRTRLYEKQADKVARQWLNFLVEGNLSAAVDLLTPSTIGGLMQPDAPGSQPAQPAAQDFVEALGKDHFVEDLRAQAEGGPIDFEAIAVRVDDRRSQPAVSIDYQLDNERGSSSVMVHCQRMNHPTFGKSWKIDAWKQAADHVHFH